MKRIGLGLIVIAVLLLGAAPLVGATTDNGGQYDPPEGCEKIEMQDGFGPVWVADQDYLLVLIKAGTEVFAWENVETGDDLTVPTGKDISHVIFCWEQTTTTTAPTSTTETTQATTTTTEYSTTTTTEAVTTTTEQETTTTIPYDTTTIPYDVVPPTVPTTTPPTELPFTGINTGLLWLGLAVFGAGVGTLGFLRWFERHG